MLSDVVPAIVSLTDIWYSGSDTMDKKGQRRSVRSTFHMKGRIALNTNLTEIIFILDRSGSMGGLENDTIGGYNAFLQKQRETEGEARVTTVLFDDRYDLLHDGVAIGLVRPMTDEEYFVRGSTALLDAVGGTLLRVGRRLHRTPEDERPGKVIVVITTDGMENSSHRFSAEQVKELITVQQDKYSWEFIFLGANIDAVETAGHLGIRAERAANYAADRVGTPMMFESMSRNVSMLRSKGVMEENWKEKLLEEHDD